MAIVIVQKPDSVSMSGNMKMLTVQTAESVVFTLAVGGETVLEETYYPGNGNLVEIDLREVVETYLSFTFPSDNVFMQPQLARQFTGNVGGTEFTFVAVRSAKARLNQSASAFLKGNWLTWQPQEKEVTYYSPEWLTYYAVEACRIRLKAYFEDGTSQTQTVVSMSAGACYTVNMQYAVVSGMFSGKRPTYYDVWTETSGGARLSYVQRYIAGVRRSEDESWYLFENSLGGLDSLRAYGALDDAPEYEHQIAQIEGVKIEYRVDTERRYTRNTGYLSPREAAWLQDMFGSLQKYAYTASGYYRIVFTDSDGSRSSQDIPSSYKFTYQFAEDSALLDLERRDDLPSDLQLTAPDGELFYLPPRLAEFPALSLAPDVLLPAQEPHTERFGTVTCGGIIDKILTELIEQLKGLDMEPVQYEGGEGGKPTALYYENLIDKYLYAVDALQQAYLEYTLIAKKDIVCYGVDEEVEDVPFPIATANVLGLVKVGSGLSITADGTLSVSGGSGGLDIQKLEEYLTSNKYYNYQTKLTGYVLPEKYTAITVEDTILSAFGKLEKNFSNYVDLFTDQTIDGVKTFKKTIFGQQDIVCYAVDDTVEDVEFPIASANVLGLVKIGEGLNITADGTLSAVGGGGVNFTPGTGLNLTSANVLEVVFGTTSTTVCRGNDSRLSDARRNPYSLSWSGYSSGSYDGSSAASISIPSNTNQLTNGAGFIYDGNRNFTSLSGSGDFHQYLAGDGSFYTISHDEISGLSTNYVKKAGDTMTGQLELKASVPTLRFSDTGDTSLYWSIQYPDTQNLAFVRQTNQVALLDGAGNFRTKGDIICYGVGDYEDVEFSISWSDITGKPSWIGSTKPSYSWSEITGKPSWIGSSKPTYTASEVGAISSITYSESGSGNVVTSVSADGRTVSVTYGSVSGGSDWNGGTVTNNIEINRSSPTLTLYGSGYWQLYHNTGNSNYLVFARNSTKLFEMRTSGVLWVYASVSEGSDDRIKTRISDVAGVLDSISKIGIFRYYLNEDITRTAQIGVSAQSMLNIFPELVNQSSNYYSVAYNRLGCIAIQGIKELYYILKNINLWRSIKDQQISQLQQDNLKLKARIEALEKGGSYGDIS